MARQFVPLSEENPELKRMGGTQRLFLLGVIEWLHGSATADTDGHQKFRIGQSKVKAVPTVQEDDPARRTTSTHGAQPMVHLANF